MDELSGSAKFARKVLKIILLPVVILVGITRFTPHQWEWLNWLFFVSLLIVVVLVIVGRIFIARKTQGVKS